MHYIRNNDVMHYIRNYEGGYGIKITWWEVFYILLAEWGKS